MKKTIHKYPLIFTGSGAIETPEWWHPVLVGIDPTGAPCVWALVDTDHMMIRRSLMIFGTGHSIPALIGDHLGSFVDGAFVWHVFDRGLAK